MAAFVEGLPASLPRRQNPQMHLFEAMIAAFDATHDMAFQQRAGEFFALFLANLYDKQTHVLGEYFEDDWSKIEPVSVEPGHQAEWVWLLKGFERITGCPTGRYRGELLASALRYRDEATGCLIDEGSTDGAIRRHTRRLWPQTEIAKAWIAQAEAARWAPRTKRARRWRGSNGITSAIPSRAAGTTSSTATAIRWSPPFLRLRSIMFSARSRKPSRCLARLDFVLTRFLHANRSPLRSKTLCSAHSHRFRRLKLFRFLKLLRWSPAPPR